MNLKKIGRRSWILLAVFLVAVIAAVGGYAYWTSTGTGTGSATVGTDAANLVVTGTTSGLLYPAGPGRTVSFTAANPASFNQSIAKIHLVSIEACTAAYSGGVCGGSVIAGCGSINNGAIANAGTNDFYMGDVTVNPATDGKIVSGATAQVLATAGTVAMNDTSANQDACKLASLKLTLSTT